MKDILNGIIIGLRFGRSDFWPLWMDRTMSVLLYLNLLTAIAHIIALLR